MITFTVTLSMGFPFIWAVADGTRDIKAFLLSALVGAVMSGVLEEKEALIKMNMSMVLLYAGVTVMGSALGNTGAANILGDAAASILSHVHNGYIIGAVFYIVSFLMTSFLYNKATTTVLIPILVITCGSLGCDPRGPVILCSLASMSSLITPMPNPVVPMAMQAGGYTQKTILKVGLVPAVIRGIVGVAIAMTIFPAFG